MKQESQERWRSGLPSSAPADSPETSCTLKQKHVGQTIVQFPQVRHRAATSSQRACS